MFLEEFNWRLLNRLVLYLNKHKVISEATAAIKANKFILTHKVAYPCAVSSDHPCFPPFAFHSVHPALPSENKERHCFYCH